MNNLISVIVPIYNVEKYLPKCIDSIINQTYQNLEIILVDDGSPDNCGKICDDYAKKDKRIKVIHKENGGVSDARNVGLKLAKGEYIAFVDPDDVLSYEMYKKLLQGAIKNDADIIQCNYCFLFETGHIENLKRKQESKTIEGALEAKRAIIKGNISNSVATKLFKKSLLENIWFNTELKIAEDRLFVYECCCKALKIVLIEDVLYYYYQRENSVIHELDIEHFENDLLVTKIFMKSNMREKDILKHLEARTVKQCVVYVCQIIRTGKFKNRLSDIRNELIKCKKQIFSSKKLTLKVKVYALGIILTPKIFYKLYKEFLKCKGVKS